MNDDVATWIHDRGTWTGYSTHVDKPTVPALFTPLLLRSVGSCMLIVGPFHVYLIPSQCTFYHHTIQFQVAAHNEDDMDQDIGDLAKQRLADFDR